MHVRHVFDVIRNKELLTELSWRKYYDNGTSLWEYKIFKGNSRKPIAFVQICQTDVTGVVFGLTLTYADDIQHPIDCNTLEHFNNVLN